MIGTLQRWGRAESDPSITLFRTNVYAERTALTFDPADLPKPRLPWAQFDILSEVARGSMGVVYRARDRKRGREIALKLLLADRTRDDEGHERFKREARSLARLNHPGIVKVFDYGVHKGIPFLTMEFVPGKNLQTLLDSNSLPLLHGVDVLLKVARAIDHAHSRGVVHRDLKPANVLIGADNRPRISDFGLAKLDDGRITLTHDGDIVGTPLYMSPEQIQGALAHVGPSSDVWAMGVMLYRMLTGALPFNGTTVEEVSREVVNKTPVPPQTWVPDVPADLERVCLTAINKASRDRYQSAGELARDLEAFLQGRAVLAGAVTPAMRARRTYRALRLHAPTLLPGLITVLALGLLAGWLAFPPPEPRGMDARTSIRDLEGAEQAWRDRAFDVLDAHLERARTLADDDPTTAARLAALEARRSESLPDLEAALAALGRPDDALALAAVAAAHGDASRLNLAAEALPADHPRRAWLNWLCAEGPAPPEAARVLGDPNRSAEAPDVPALERARAAIDAGSFRLASATLAPLLARGDLAARITEARLLLQRGLPGAAKQRLTALPVETLPPSLAHEVELLQILIELGPELPTQLSDLAQRAPDRRCELEAQRWAALAGAATIPGSCPTSPPTLQLAWLRAGVAAYAGTIEKLLIQTSEGAPEPPKDLKLAAEFPNPDEVGLPVELHDPLVRAKVVLLRLGVFSKNPDLLLEGDFEVLNGHTGRPDVDGVRGPLAAYLAKTIPVVIRRGEEWTLKFKVGESKEASPGCDPWPLRLAEASLAAHSYYRELEPQDPQASEAHIERARRAARLALAMNPFHRRARLVSAHVELRRCALSLVKNARRQLRTDAQIAALLWPRDPGAAGWERIRMQFFGSYDAHATATPDPLLSQALAASRGSDPLLGEPSGAPACTLAVDLIQTNLAKLKSLPPSLEGFPDLVDAAQDDPQRTALDRARWQAVAVALDPTRIDELLLAEPPVERPWTPGEEPDAVDRLARVLGELTRAAQGEALPPQWVTRARSDLEFTRRRWPALGIEAVAALVELADGGHPDPQSWSEVSVVAWPGAVGDALLNGRIPAGALGVALRQLAGAGMD